MEKKSVVFRCPGELVRRMDELCRLNGIDRTRLITCAMLSIIRSLAEQNVISPLPDELLPPPPTASCNRMRRRRAHT